MKRCGAVCEVAVAAHYHSSDTAATQHRAVRCDAVQNASSAISVTPSAPSTMLSRMPGTLLRMWSP